VHSGGWQEGCFSARREYAEFGVIY